MKTEQEIKKMAEDFADTQEGHACAYRTGLIRGFIAGYHSALSTDEAEETIKQQQDRIIGKLTRENEYLKDSQQRRNDWLRQAKKDAGFPDAISFDNVWAAALKAYLATQPEPDTKNESTKK